MSRYHYRVQAEQSGDWWAIRVSDLPGAFSQARRLSQVEDMARDLIAFALEVDINDVSVTVEPVLPNDMTEAIQQASAARDDAKRAAKQERDAMRSAASILRSHGLAQAEIGRLLSVSHQRVHQLLNPDPRRRDAKQRGTKRALID